MEHRWGERHKVSLDVQLWDKSYRPVQGQTVNLSSSGAFVRTAQGLIPLSHLFVELELPPQVATKRLTLKACVIRAVRGGAGIEWCEPLPFEAASLLPRPRTSLEFSQRLIG